jgi:hypothetical protein
MSKTARLTVASVLVCLFAVQLFAAQKPAPCKVSDYPEYNAKIKEFTTEPFFLTEIVDHLPLSSCVPPPDQFLKHIVGAPNVLTHVKDIHDYMRLLASKSPRVKVFELGKSEEGREMLLVAIADEKTIANLDRYRDINARLADPRNLTDADAQKLLAEGKPMYWAAGSIHSTETGAPEMMMELAYRLAVEESPFIQTIRKNAIILLTPVLEVDGRDRWVDMYMYNKAHPNEPQRRLLWWGHYVAHDNNRDALTLSLALSRNIMAGFFKFHPQVLHDLHESVAYLYVSTGTGPYNAWLDPITIGEWEQMAFYETQEMTKRGVPGVWTYGYGDGWGPHVLRFLGNGHNSIGRLYETFGNGGADTRVRTLSAAQTSREWFRPFPPLPKVKWSIRNNINMQQSALLLGMYNMARNADTFLHNFYLKSKRSVAKARTEGPAAYVFPADDPRPAEQARLLNLLKRQGVEVHKTSAEYRLRTETPAGRGSRNAEPTVQETAFPAGSYLVRMDQPYSRMADMMLDQGYYNPKDPRPYDETGWTLSALRNVKAVRVVDTAVLDTPMAKTEGDLLVTGAINGTGRAFLINHTADNPLATFRFKLATVKMDAAEQPFEVDGRKFRAGSFIIRDADRIAIEAAAKELGLTVIATDSAIKVPTHPLAAPRVALLHNWSSTQDDGWFRLGMDNLKIPYTYFADTRVRETPNLREKFDVIIVPPTFNNLVAALRGVSGRVPIAYKNTPEMTSLEAPGLDTTDDIRGGLGYSGLANLEKFVSDGGLLIAVSAATALPIQGGITDGISTVDTRTLYAPGTVVNAQVGDRNSPIAYGYEGRLQVYFRNGPIFRLGGGGGRGGPASEEALTATAQGGRGSGRGSLTDPDVVQGRSNAVPESVRNTDDTQATDFFGAPAPREAAPRIVLRFAAERDLLYSGLLANGSELGDRPAVVDVPHGKGHVVLFSNNPFWREETMGSFFLVFNAMLNYDHLDAGRPAVSRPAATAEEDDQN